MSNYAYRSISWAWIVLMVTALLAFAGPGFARPVLDTTTLMSAQEENFFDAAAAPNGVVGVVYKVLGDRYIVYIVCKQVQADGSVTTETLNPSDTTFYGPPILVYDSASTPHVFAATNQYSQVAHFYQGAGGWQKEIVFTLDGNAYPNLSTSVEAAHVGPGDVFHLLCSGGYGMFHISNASGAWPSQPSVLEIIPANYVDIFGNRLTIRGSDLAVDTANHAHVVYSTLYETRYLTDSSGAWAGEDIYRDQDIDYWPVENPSIAVDSAGTPAIAGTEMGHAVTGSVTFAKLRYLKRSAPGIWDATVIAASDDNYAGNDGTQFTGIHAQLGIDSQNQAHIVFTDMASSHNANGWNYTKDGQIRYAAQVDGQWSISTLYAQSPDNGEMLELWLPKTIASTGITVIGQEVIRVGNVYDLYNDNETYNLLLLAPPPSGSPGPAIPATPTLSVTTDGTHVDLSWTGATGATGYTLYYAPYPAASPIGSLEMGTATSAGFDLFPGAAFYLAVKASSTAGCSDYSNIEWFSLP